MKKIEIAKAIGLADEKYVAEAAPSATKTRSAFWRKFAIIAACVSIIVTSVCIGLLPNQNEGVFDAPDKNALPEELKPYADSEYIDLLYAIYKKDHASLSRGAESYLDGEYKYFVPKAIAESSIFIEYYFSIADTLDAEGLKPDGIDASTYSATCGGNYVETTDNQVEGVTEADLFKRTRTHIFYLDKNELTLRVYSIAGEESRQISAYSLRNRSENEIKRMNVNEMFLSDDGDTLTVIGHKWFGEGYVASRVAPHTSVVHIISLDVSDPENIKEKSSFSITGSYNTARVVDGKILLFSSYNVNRDYNDDYSEIEKIVPSVNCGDGFAPIPADDIIFPENPTSRYYTVITKLNESDLAFEGSMACLSYSSAVYVSTDKMFLTRSYSEHVEREKGGEKCVDRVNMTEITAISYKGESFEMLGSAVIEGSVKNQYSLDEYNGVLRAVTTTGGTSYLTDTYLLTDEGLYYGEPDGERVKTQSIATNAALYCIDLSSFEIVAEVRNFAPNGETVESVRFDGTNAYVCTAKVITFTDPVYFFDLSDMSNITYTDTGVIEGYSSSLVDFGDGLLLGIGYGENRSTLKIEVYAEEGNSVISLASYEVKNTEFSANYKAYYIDRECGLVGLMLNEWSVGKGSRYLLLGFDGYQLFEVVSMEFDKMVTPDYARATLADDYFYVMINNEFRSIKLFD